MEAGHPVVPIHPNVVKACRPRYRAAGGKSNPGDAYMLADILRTDGHRFRPLQPCSDEIKALRALVRGRDDLVAERVCLPTACAACWKASGPAPPLSSPTSIRRSRSPSCSATNPKMAARLGEKRIKGFLASRSYCGRRSAAELLARLRAAPTGRADEAKSEAKGEMVRALAAVLERLVGEPARRDLPRRDIGRRLGVAVPGEPRRRHLPADRHLLHRPGDEQRLAVPRNDEQVRREVAPVVEPGQPEHRLRRGEYRRGETARAERLPHLRPPRRDLARRERIPVHRRPPDVHNDNVRHGKLAIAPARML